MNNKIIFLLLGIFMLSFVASAPPVTQVQNFPQGYFIETPAFDYIANGEDLKLHAHVYNSSNGYIITNTSATCYVHLYDNYGNHMLQQTMDWEGPYDFEYYINGSNFTTNGDYSFIIFCYNGGIGGFVQGAFVVTENGNEPPSEFVIIGFSVLLLFLLAGSVTLMLKALGHLVERNFDLMDVGVMWGSYFALLGAYQLSTIYLGNPIINDWLSLFVKIYAFPMVIVPIIALFLSLFRQYGLKQERAKQW